MHLGSLDQPVISAMRAPDNKVQVLGASWRTDQKQNSTLQCTRIEGKSRYDHRKTVMDIEAFCCPEKNESKKWISSVTPQSMADARCITCVWWTYDLPCNVHAVQPAAC